jgi:hypothetical protein
MPIAESSREIRRDYPSENSGHSDLFRGPRAGILVYTQEAWKPQIDIQT